MTTVAAAVIVQDKRILLAQRSGSTLYPYRWCSPGGKVEPGESVAEALKRELLEEIGCDCTISNHITTWTADSFTVVFLLATIVSGKPMPSDATVGLGWFDADDMSNIALTPANFACFDDIINCIGQ